MSKRLVNFFVISLPLPDFTHDEQYLINCAKSTKASGQSNSYMWGYLIGSTVLAVFGAYHGSVAMLLAAFGIVCGFRIYEEFFQAKWLPLWRSIIAKYELAAQHDEGSVESDAPPEL